MRILLFSLFPPFSPPQAIKPKNNTAANKIHGTIREFGVTSDSNIETSDGTALFWLLSRVIDKQGNVISYQYEEVINNGEFYLNRIEYASGRSIRFSYETRKDKQTGYYAGAVLNSNKILKNISTYIGQMQFKQYQFNYNTYENGLYTQLTEIIESGQNGQRYNWESVLFWEFLRNWIPQ